MPRPRRSGPGRWRALGLALGLSTATALVVVPAAGAAQPGVPMGSLRVLAGPVAANGRVLVVNVATSGYLQLSAINPATQRVAWQQPYSASDLAAGESFTPTAIGNIAIDLAPVGNPSSGNVRIQGVNISTGQVVWTYKEQGTTSDVPAACASSGTFCLGWQSASVQGLIEVNAANGSLLRTIAGPIRALAKNLYETSATTPTVLQIGSAGQELWSKPTASIFGPVNNDPDNGWAADPHGPLNVGSFANATNATSTFVSGTTTGFSIATGDPAWTTPGTYNCVGALEFLSPPVLCRLSGAVVKSSNPAVMFGGLRASLSGFNLQTGKVLWTQSDQAGLSLLEVNPLPIADAQHIVIRQRGVPRLLDVSSGTTAAVAAGSVLWCSTSPEIKVAGIPSYEGTNTMTGSNQYFGCTASGRAVAGHSATQPSVVGVKAGSKFFWLTPRGLAAAPAS